MTHSGKFASFGGIISFLPTVFSPEGGIDEPAMRANVHALYTGGIRAMFVTGASGEFFSLSPGEFRSVVRSFVEEAGADVLKIAGCGSARWSETLEHAAWLNGCGVDAVLAVIPFFVPLSREEKTACLREFCAACPDIGVIHYNTTYAEQVRFAPADYAALAGTPNFWGAKHGRMTDEEWREHQRYSAGLRHLTLDDRLTAVMKMGGHGAFSALAGFAPRFALEFFSACQQGMWDRADAMGREWNRFFENVYLPISKQGYSDIATDKALVDCFGVLRAGIPRPPLRSVPERLRAWAAREIGRGRYFQDTSGEDATAASAESGSTNI